MNKSKKIMKKMLVLVLAAMMASSIVSCNSSEPSTANNSSSGQAEEEIPTVTVVTTWDPGINISDESDVWVEWGKRTGVKFEATINPRDNHKDKVNILLASKELPDMLKFFQDDVSWQEYGNALFEPLDSYLEAGQLPNFQKYLEKYEEIEPKMRANAEGKIYGFPIVQDFDYFSNLWYVRNDMLESQGLSASDIQTLDDFKEACLALKEAKGSDYITSSRLGYQYYSGMVGAYFGQPFGLVYDAAYEDSTNQYVIGALEHSDMLKTFIETEAWMIENKLLHPNFLTMKDQELFAGYADGSFPLQREQFTMPYTPISSMNPNNDPDIDIQPIYPFEINGKKVTVPSMVHYNTAYRGPWCVNKNSKNKDKIMSALDYTYSDEGVELFFLGVEGETFERDENTPSGYRLINVQSVWTKNEDGTYPDGMKTLKDYGYDTWWIAGAIPEHQRFALLNYKEGEEDLAFRTMDEAAAIKEKGLLRAADPEVTLTKEESDKVAEQTTAFNTMLEENVAKFILGTRPMSEFDAFLDELRQFDLQETLDIYNSKLK